MSGWQLSEKWGWQMSQKGGWQMSQNRGWQMSGWHMYQHPTITDRKTLKALKAPLYHQIFTNLEKLIFLDVGKTEIIFFYHFHFFSS